MPDLLQYDFMVRALIGGVLVGALAPAIGLFLVLRRLSLIADSLSHVALAGVAIGLLTGAFPPAVALGTTTVAAGTIEIVRARNIMPSEAALAVVLYSALAVAVVIISLADGFNVDLFAYLFGSILTVNPGDLWLLAGLAGLVLAFVVLFYVELAQISLDGDLAQTTGVRVFQINLALAILTGAVITLSMRVVGVLLVGALIVIPVMAALRLATGMRPALGLSVVIGVAGAIGGLTISYYANIAAGGAVVLTLVGFLVLTIVYCDLRPRFRQWRAG